VRGRGIACTGGVAALGVAAACVGAAGFLAAAATADPSACDETAPRTGAALDEPLACEEPPPAAPTATDTTSTETVTTLSETTETEPPPAATVPPPSPARASRPRPSPTKRPVAPRPTPPPAAGGLSAPRYDTPPLGGGPYVFPVVGEVSFADTWGAPRATVSWHHGVDIFALPGTPVVAVADGTLFSVGWNRIGGRRLWLRDREGNFFYYAHLSGFARVARDGARVRAGTAIGFVGDTGDAAGTPHHLHFEIHPASLLSLGYDGAVNPYSYVSSWRRLDRAADATGPSLGAPAAGAFLLEYEDISSASGLSSASLERSLEATAVNADPAGRLPPRQAAAPPAPAPQAGDDGAAITLALEAAAEQRTGVWDSLASCESGGDWGANTGNGYSGGLQFHPGTWLAHGGADFAPAAHLATREEQVAIAERVLITQGWRAWPACSALLGLPTFAPR
jgi:murein DD-endopeptidase MepM/ murein hydrolase activator NlpD